MVPLGLDIISAVWEGGERGGGVYECCVGDGPNLIDKFCQRSVGGRFRFGGR